MDERDKRLLFALVIVTAVYVVINLIFSTGVIATPSDKVMICHATSSETNPYTSPEVNTSSIDEQNNQYLNGHGDHDGDIIPPFQSPIGTVFAGKNWTEEGQEIWSNGCKIIPPATSPPPSPTESSATPTPTAESPTPTQSPTVSTPTETPTDQPTTQSPSDTATAATSPSETTAIAEPPTSEPPTSAPITEVPVDDSESTSDSVSPPTSHEETTDVVEDSQIAELAKTGPMNGWLLIAGLFMLCAGLTLRVYARHL